MEERRILTLYYVLDGDTFAFATALVSSVNKTASREEHTPTLSMGVFFNHVASVTMPLLGGELWVALGYRWAFLIVQKLPGRGFGGR